jgi:Zinc-binding dehydrogenase
MAVEGAKLEIPIAAEYALADAAKAHERLASGHVLGKIVLGSIECARSLCRFVRRDRKGWTAGRTRRA